MSLDRWTRSYSIQDLACLEKESGVNLGAVGALKDAARKKQSNLHFMSMAAERGK